MKSLQNWSQAEMRNFGSVIIALFIFIVSQFGLRFGGIDDNGNAYAFFVFSNSTLFWLGLIPAICVVASIVMLETSSAANDAIATKYVVVLAIIAAIIFSVIDGHAMHVFTGIFLTIAIIYWHIHVKLIKLNG